MGYISTCQACFITVGTAFVREECGSVNKGAIGDAFSVTEEERRIAYIA